MQKLKLYSSSTSSCSFRVRVALNLKGIDYDLLTPPEAGLASDDYGAINPQRLIPYLVNGDTGIGQSLSIIEYAEEVLPGVKLLPEEPVGRARVRGIAQYIVSEIQPLQNTRLDSYMKGEGIDVLKFKQYWIRRGLTCIEAVLSQPETGKYCHGDAVTVADCCLVPQVYNSVHIYSVSIEDFPNIKRIYEALADLPAVQKAWPVKS